MLQTLSNAYNDADTVLQKAQTRREALRQTLPTIDGLIRRYLRTLYNGEMSNLVLSHTLDISTYDFRYEPDITLRVHVDHDFLLEDFLPSKLRTDISYDHTTICPQHKKPPTLEIHLRLKLGKNMGLDSFNIILWTTLTPDETELLFRTGKLQTIGGYTSSTVAMC